MRLPSFRRLYKDDFSKENQDLVERLSFPINSGIETLYEALNNKLTFRDNFAGTVTEFDVTVNSAGIPTNRTVFNLKANTFVEGIIVLQVRSLTTSPIYPTSGVTVTGDKSGGQVQVNHITGLPPGVPFRIKVQVPQN